jgi:hypothetical protein
MWVLFILRIVKYHTKFYVHPRYKTQVQIFWTLGDDKTNVHKRVNTSISSAYLGNVVSSSSYKVLIAFLSTILCLPIADNIKEE